jgi:glycosyltransferase involved in cell wall biosynthesis
MLVAYDVAPLKLPRTGVGHYAATLLDHLIALDPDLQFRFYSLTAVPDSRMNLPQAQTTETSNGEVSMAQRLVGRLPRGLRRTALTAWTMAGRPAAEKFVGSPDVIHGTNFWIPPISRRYGVVTIHDLTFWLYPEFCTPAVRRYRIMMPKILERCALAITPSETVRGELSSELGFPESRIVVTPEGVRRAFVTAKPDPQLAARLGINRRFVLSAGTQEPRKNLDRLIESFRLLTDLDLQLVIVGPGGWGSIDLPAVARKHGVEESVIFSGYLDDVRLGSLMAGATAFAYPSLYEGFGLPPLEAMAAGVPVVAGRAGALPETLGEAPFWCDPEDVESIAGAIREAASDDEGRSAAIERGRTQVTRYSWEETARLTHAAYQAIADS